VATLLLLGSLPAARAQAEDPDAYGDDYREGDFGRIRFEENGVAIHRASSEDRDSAEEAGSTNSPLFPGDSLKTGSDQRVELQLATGTLVRVDTDSDLTLQSLPGADARYRDNAVLRLSVGTIRVVSASREKDELRIDTGSASVYVLGEGDFRIDVDGRGQTSVSSERGVAEVVGDGGSVLVRGGMKTIVDPGSVPDEPRARSSFASDPFDRWCSNRDRAYEVEGRRDDDGVLVEEVPEEIQPYYGELSTYGQWVDVPEYGQAWSPYDVGPGWRPYTDGYWSYGPGGYFWVSNEPWGWAPYHYGRWQWVTGFGWCWIPGRVFAGAWVSWSWGSLYLGWAPLDYWGRPCFYGSLSYGYYDPNCWTFVSYQHIGTRDCRRHAVPVSRVGSRLRDHVVVTRPPQVGPRRLANAPDWRERAVREARQDTRAQMRPIERDRVPQRSLRDVESQLARRRTDSVPARDRAPQVRDRQQAPARPDRRPAAAPRDTSPRAGAPSRPYPRTILVDPRDDARRSDRDDDRQRDGGAESRQASDRVREMYRNLSRPPETREREATPSRPRTERPEARDDSRQRERSRPQAAPRSQQPPRQQTAPRSQQPPSRQASPRPQQPPRQQASPRSQQPPRQQASPRPQQPPRQSASPRPQQPKPPKQSSPKKNDSKQGGGDKKQRHRR
jgi:hypothetical protein